MSDVSGSALPEESLVLHDASLGPQATPWIPVGVSAASGALAAWFLLPQVVSGASTAYAAVFWVCLSVCGTFSLAAYCASRAFGVLEGGDSPVHRVWALALAGNASLFVPLAILVRQQQSLAVVWAAFIGLGFAVLVRRYPGESWSAAWESTIEPPLFQSVATTAPSPGAVFAFIATVAMEASLLAHGSGLAIPAILFSGFACLVIAALVVPTAASRRPWRASRMRASAIAKTALATAAALLLLLRFPGDGSGGLLGKEGYGRSSQTALNRSAGAGLLSGAILLADESTVKRLVAPHLFAKMRVAPARMQTATQIPFSGEYWIRGWPTRQRPRDVAEHRASPLNFSFDTVDQSPIHMQAYQKLGVPLSLAGVHALEVGFTNRDPEPDTLGLRVSLRDASSKGLRWMNLAAMRVPPLESGAMRFVIPQGAAMQAFDEILLDVQLYQPRMHRSAKLTIDWFRLETGR